MTDETVVVKKRGRKAASEATVHRDTLPLDEVDVEPETSAEQVIDMPLDQPAPITPPEDLLRPILEGVTATPTTLTMVQFVSTMLQKGSWILVPIKADILQVAWNIWKEAYGVGDPERFLRTVHAIMGIAMDGSVKTVWSMKLE
jgi:hypothetical protein